MVLLRKKGVRGGWPGQVLLEKPLGVVHSEGKDGVLGLGGGKIQFLGIGGGGKGRG